MQKINTTNERKQLWAMSLALTILSSFSLIIFCIATYFLIKAFISIDDTSSVAQIANSIDFGYATTFKNGVLTIGETNIDVTELLNLGLSFIAVITVLGLIGSMLNLIAAILGLRFYNNQSKAKMLFG